MRITSKGQVTIPQAIREQAGLHPHTEVEFQITGGKVVLSRSGKQSPHAQKAVGRLRGSLKNIRMTTDEIMALTRDNV